MEPLRIGVLAQMAKSPQHAKHALDHGSEATRTMTLGSLAHAILLGKSMPVVYPGPVRRGKEFEAFKANYPEGETIYIESEIEEARKLSHALMTHPEAYRLLLGRREETLHWEFAGRPCRGTPDVFNTAAPFLTDLKTTVDASPNRFPRQALNLAYHAKLAWYLDGAEAAGVGKLERAFIVAAENKPPYAVCVYQLSDRALDFGRRLYRTWLEQFLICERSNEWRSYLPDVLDAPEEGFGLEGLEEDVA